MNYKVKGAIKRNKKGFIVAIVIWVLIAIVVIPPITYSGYCANITGRFDLGELITTYYNSALRPFQAIGTIFAKGIFGDYISQLLVATVLYSIFLFIGLVRSAPKSEYTDIEHGSSDWSQHGEQYSVLSKNKGIILAKNNYLPVDKRGNVNVLVVGRFRFR